MPNYLVIGSGGREHALAWKLATDSASNTVWVAPGNAGIARDEKIAGCIDVDIKDFDALAKVVEGKEIDLVVVGPEAPLAAGITDDFERRGIKIFGPNKVASQLETSKAFAKEILEESGVKTATYEVFDNANDALHYLTDAKHPIVIKADGLAAGKGVFICNDLEASKEAIHAIFEEQRFGESGSRVVIEEHLVGPELSFMVITDGTSIVPVSTSRDHKRLLNNDEGPNTGGMGAITPSPDYTSELYSSICSDIFEPVLKTLREKKIDYCGFLYAGLMLTEDGPYVLEFNVRMGDPETQALMLGMKGDLGPLLHAAVERRLETLRDDATAGGVSATDAFVRDSKPTCCVVMASEEYPESVTTNHVIEGLDDFGEDVKVFFAGVGERDGALINTGGRVLGVTAVGETTEDARRRAYEAVAKIDWPGVQYRDDIGG